MKANVRSAQIKSATDIAIKMATGMAIMTLHSDFGFGRERLQRFLDELEDTAEYYKKHYQDNGGQFRGKVCETNSTIFLALERDLKSLGINLHFTED